MLFTRYILSAVLLVIAFQGICIAEGKFSEFIHKLPKEKIYSMDIQEVHQCVACHFDQKPRKDFLRCLRLLSQKNKNLAKQCCDKIYDDGFCKNASAGKIDFDRICHDPSKAVQVNRCFWKATDTEMPCSICCKTAKDVVTYKQCRKKIIDGFCTTRTEQ